MTVRPELVEGLPFTFSKEAGQGSDRLSANGLGE